MSNKMMYIQLFNSKADEFCKDLVSTFPEVNEFKQLKSGMLLLKNLDEKKPREIFHSFMTEQLKDKIITRDESFFMTEVHNHATNVDGIDTSQWENIVELLRNLWVGLSNDNKESIWKYFHVLITINDKCTM
jgi:hypothetical protein